MLARIFLILTIAAGTLCPAAWAQDEGVSAPGAQARVADDIESRLMSDKFFAAQLADAIISSGKYGALVKDPSSDRSELRMQLVGWIQSNPSSAGKLYRAGQELPDSARAPVPGGKFKIEKIKFLFTPEFLQATTRFVGQVKSGNLSSEEQAAAGNEFFEGGENTYGPAPTVTGMSGGSGKGVTGYAGFRRNDEALDIPALDWRLNTAGITKESSAADTALTRLKKELAYDRAVAAKRLSGSRADPWQIMADVKVRQNALSATKNGKPVRDIVDEMFSPREKTLDSTLQSYKTFKLYLAQFGSRKNLNDEESAIIERLRGEVRGNIAKLHINARVDHLTRDNDEIKLLIPAILQKAGLTAQAADKYAASGAALITESEVILSEYGKLLAMAKTGTISLPDLYIKMAALSAADTEWRYKWLIYVTLPTMAEAAVQLRSQPKFDRMAQDIFEKRYSSSTYARTLDSLTTYRKAVSAATEAVERQDFTYALGLFAAAEGGTPEEGVLSVLRQIELCRDTINQNRDRAERFQTAFFEGPFYRPAAPLMRRLLPRVIRAANTIAGT